MTKPHPGRVVRRLRQERSLTQSRLAGQLGISVSYLNLIEHGQRSLTVSLLLKLSRVFDLSLDELSGSKERRLALGLREALSDPLLGVGTVGEEAITAMAAHPDAARAILSLSRAWMAAREDASSLKLPSGHRVRLPQEEARAAFNEQGNHFPELEDVADTLRSSLENEDGGVDRELTYLVVERLRRQHGVIVRIVPMVDSLRVYQPEFRVVLISDLLRRESRSFQLAFQLMLLEISDPIETILARIEPSTPEASAMIRIGLLNYAAAALLMPYERFLLEAVERRYDVELLAARFGVSYEQAAHRLSTLGRPGRRGVPFFFVRTDAAGNMLKAFAGAGFPLTQSSGSCPLWVANTTRGERVAVQVGQLPDASTFLCFARVLTGASTSWKHPPPRYVVTLGCEIDYAASVVYADGIDIERARTPIGISCRLCDWTSCRSRAFPALQHRLLLDVNQKAASPVAQRDP